MFPLRKLTELPPKSRLRKIVLILQNLEIGLAQGKEPDQIYLQTVCELAREELSKQAAQSQQALSQRPTHTLQALSKQAARSKRTLSKQAAGSNIKAYIKELKPAQLLRFLNDLRHEILAYLGAEPTEWDFLDFDKGILDSASRTALPLRVYIEDVRSPFNVGSIFRTAEAFAVEHIYLSPHTPRPTHRKAAKTARGCEKIVDWSVGPLSVLECTAEVFALELGGTPIDEFNFPKRGTVLIGSEELGLSPEALTLADAGLGRISIAMAGAKRSLNVATAFGILMQKWFAALAQKA